jgi:hypothetical protein
MSDLCRSLLLIWSLFLLPSCTHHTLPTATPAMKIPFDTNPNQSLTYREAIGCYEQLAAAYPKIFHLTAVGSTDIGEPLHVAVLSTNGEFDPAKIRQSGRRILMINNGIHPGEPEGIDATVMLLRDYLSKPALLEKLRHVVLVVIPVYNVDGCLNRNSYSRANQNGPEAYGFRGNARNFDLNRDFVKCDTHNAQTFNEIFQTWSPDVFVDNHTSNGADYQYVMTLIATQHNKLEAPLGQFLQETMLPALYGGMKKRGWEMIPYVDTPGETPDSGLSGFCDYGRYSTGYAAMWNTIGFMPETHMLKPFKDRVWSTYAFMDEVIGFTEAQHEAIGKARAEAFRMTQSKTTFALDYAPDPDKKDMIDFKGYAAKYKPSEVSGQPRLWYDRSEPYTKAVPYFNYFKPSLSVEKPAAYVVPCTWEAVIERLKRNGVVMHPLREDKTFETESYVIKDFKTRNAWEGHYFHYDVRVEKKVIQRHFLKGDYLIRTNQPANRYILETLEPQAPDSWLAWNFFESVLMQKEGYSGYVFEDLAAQFLKDHPEIRAELEAKKKAEPEFASNSGAQLDWVYRRSPWFEPTYRLYPVARVLNVVEED